MLKTEKVIVVEGKYDAIKLANLVDAAILRTDGFGIFKDDEKKELLRTLAKKRGLILLTDGDSAGMLIRNYIRGFISPEYITDVYIPDLYGKEKRKTTPSKEGKLGVEGIPDAILMDALRKAGITEEGDCVAPRAKEITIQDFYRDGLSGGPDSRQKRLDLQKKLGLPERMTGKQLLRIVNMLVSYDEYKELVAVEKGKEALSLPEPVAQALNRLETSGYEAYVVGGCTRDALLGHTPEDWDITTSARPEETLVVFSDCRTIETGLQHGTVTVMLGGMQLEITTYRVDGTYADARHPDSVTFTPNLTEDLARRDFTMNAIAYSPARGMVDLYGGAEDIETGTIRCVGDPDLRLTEDALRILRALRFASVLNFSIEPETAGAIHRLKENIRQVALERVSVELQKLLCGEGVFSILQEYRDVFAVVLPELESCFDFDQKNHYHIYDVYTHICKAVEAVEPEPDLRLAMLLHDIGKPKTFFTDDKGVGHFYGHGKVSKTLSEPIVKRLRLPTKMQETVLTLVEYHDYPLEDSKKLLLRRLHKFGPDLLQKLIKVQKADVAAQNPEYAGRLDTLRTIEETLTELLQEEPVYTPKGLAVNGKDLLDLGMKPGPEVGALLEDTLQQVMAGELSNEREALLTALKERIQP